MRVDTGVYDPHPFDDWMTNMNFHNARKMHGLTLVELMVTVAILAVVAAIAIPAYQTQAAKSKRADGIAMLMDVAAKQERFIIDNNVYTSDMTALGYSASPAASEKGYYKVSAALTDSNLTYTLTATAQSTQASDVCGNLTLTSKGVRGWSVSTATNCW